MGLVVILPIHQHHAFNESEVDRFVDLLILREELLVVDSQLLEHHLLLERPQALRVVFEIVRSSDWNRLYMAQIVDV